MRGLDVDQLSTIPRSGTQQDVTVDSDLTPDVETEGHGIGLHVHVCAFVMCRNSSPLVHVHVLNYKTQTGKCECLKQLISRKKKPEHYLNLHVPFPSYTKYFAYIQMYTRYNTP